MPIEIEAKMRLDDADAIESRLEALSAVFECELLESNTFYDTAENELRAGDEGLRVRRERRVGGGEKVVITHKGPRTHGRLKSRSESQVVVGDADAADELLQALGYHPRIAFEKRRRRWRLDGCLVELDTLPYLGGFIEIEGPNDEAVESLRERLGLGERPLIPASYASLLRSYLVEHRLHETFVPLDPAHRPDLEAEGGRVAG